MALMTLKTANHTTVPMILKDRCTTAARRAFSASTMAAIAAMSSAEYIAPVGLLGEFTIIARVFGPTAAASAAMSGRNDGGIEGTLLRTPPKCPQ